MDTLAIAWSNLTSIPVLIFLLAIVASRISESVKLPDSIYQGIAIFLLLGIGLKGGHAIKVADHSDVICPAVGALALGIVIPLLAYWLLTLTRRFSQVDRGSLAAHYGSTSLVTFTAGLVMLESIGMFVEPFVAALLAIMEIPGIVVGVYLGTRGTTGVSSKRETFKEIFFGKTVFLLIAGLVVGFVAPEASYEKVEPFFVALQPGILALFLLQLGVMVGSRLESLREGGWWLPVFAIVMPVVGGTLGALTGVALGMSVGGATMLAVLAASASYIAAPAAISLAMPNANLSISLSASLGMTFPFNLIVGLPLYLALATWFSEVLG
ncbi:MAG: sodium-dependent bicarbonate transport family permease [Microbacteriaceae bacterium]